MSTQEEIVEMIKSKKKIKYCATQGCMNKATWGYKCPTHCPVCKINGMFNPKVGGYCIGSRCNDGDKKTVAHYGKIVGLGEYRVMNYCKICLICDIDGYSYKGSIEITCCSCGKKAQYFKGDDEKTMFCGNCVKLPIGYDNLSAWGSCSYTGCIAKSANYGLAGSKTCRKHTSHVFTTSNVCAIRGCEKGGSYGPDGKKWFCSSHKTIESIPSAKKCVNCNKSAKYGLFKDKIRTYCSEHMDPNKHVNLAKTFCITENCMMGAAFKEKNDNYPTKCGTHKTETMIAAYGYHCENCGQEARYNFEGFSPAYCKECKIDEMINVRTKRCKCGNIPFYGYRTDGKILCCGSCMEDGMINLTKQKCIITGCELKSTYGNEKGIPLMCKKHGLERGMERTSLVCEVENCNNSGMYGDIGNSDRRCLTHKLETDINVHHTRCKKCGLLKYYGIPGSNISSCVECKTSGMIKYPKKSCQQCTNPATHGWRTGVQLYCKLHAPENVPDLTEYECIECGKVLPIDSDSKCHICSGSKKMKIQEIVKDYLDKNEINYTSYDQPIGSVKYRPDFYFNRGSVKIIVEVDENQHKDYKNDNERMIEIHENIKCDGICFVRFNPDSYFSGGMKRDPNLDIRLRELKKVIEMLLDNPKRIVGPVVVYLYYDGMKDDLQLEKITNH